jgi:cell division protein FtsB
MSEVYACPFCGIEKPKKDQIDFHLKYGHSDSYHLLQEDVEIHDLEEKLEELCKQRNILEKEIDLMKSIIEKKKDD